MKKINILENLEYGIDKPVLTVLLDNSFIKEIRIVFRKNQEMKAHKSKYPITVEVLEGCIDFGISGERHLLSKGTLLVLDASILHDLLATEDTTLRLSIVKSNSV